MNTKMKGLLSVFLIGALSACTIDDGGYSGYTYPAYDFRPYRPYMGGSMVSTGGDYIYQSDSYEHYREKPQVQVPDSFYTGNSRSPVSFKDNDKTWINSQNPYGYTIQVADGEKPSQVAGKLQKVPKDDRRAEIRYQKEGKNHYKGVYGTYETKEAAQQAMEKLPDDVKQGATVEGWHNVQGSMNQ